ncbi:Utp14-domain-containing protein [Lophium mytilinum]|uniref:Utp14-domain-containing protein n=1 Tax=Lophium mytilinum TaxID=390894 RepID=A0A6A6QNF0_9PEZI|nr:Utp14-domain-containing protein [Lophium mytilinum]
MPPRISRSSIPSSKPKGKPQRNKTKAAKRSLNAFAIAGREAPERTKIRKNRLGELEPDGVPTRRKRPHDEEEEEGEEEENPKRAKRGQDEDEVDEGSDSEGNEWQMGHVDLDDDDDSDIDSDEAFGESDEERFAGWTFRGSSTTQNKSGGDKAAYQGKGKGKAREVDEDMDLDLDEEASDEGESDDESLGDDAIDLATALDQYVEDETERKEKKSKRRSHQQESEDEPSDEDDLDANGLDDLDVSGEDGEDEEDEDAADKLQDLIASLHPDEAPVSKGPRRFDLNESARVAETGPSGSQTLDLDLLMANADAETRKTLKKRLRDDAKPSKRNDISGKLDAPLPKRQQDRLNRVAANKEANQTLSRWVDTVKQNRRAEHISFPLQDPDAGIPMGTNQMIPTAQMAPMNDLESTIQSILVESGLASKSGKSEEEKIREFEELETNKLPLEEVAKRRKELRRVRELMFREEIRAKRVKKIKSKSYRRVHRRERERDAQREKDALAADGVDVSEDEREYNDRRRAEERMGSKHRDSKWAKGVKKSGRGVWDDDARAGVTEMARRNEELRRRIEGKEVHDEDHDNSDLSSEDDEEDDDVDEEEAENRRLRRQLDRLEGNRIAEDSFKLGSMMFMQKAEQARKARNDEDIERIRRELAGEEAQSDEEDERLASKGRRKFGPVSLPSKSKRQPLNDFEEKPGSGDEIEDDELDVILDRPGNSRSGKTRSAGKKAGYQSTRLDSEDDAPTSNPYLAATAKKIVKGGPQSKTSKSDSKKASSRKPPAASISAADADGWQTVTYRNDGVNSDQEDSDDGLVNLPFVQRNQELTAKGFAGDDVDAQFAEEKKAAIVDEDDKIVDNTLPGWGNWVGEGVNARQQARNKGRWLTKQAGIKAKDRKDAKLERVIINEKRVKKTSKYLAPILPHPFESKAQYERSLRMPLGPEWSTKSVFQDSTKPRVLIKQGIILPMEKPMV